MSACARCGSANGAGASFCHACGATLSGAGAPGSALPDQPAPPALRVRPIGVTIIGIVFGVGAGTLALGALVLLFLVMMGFSLAGAFATSWFGALAGGLAALAFAIVLFLVAMAGVMLAVGIGVLRGREWAWVATLVLMGLNGLSGLAALASRDVDGIVSLAVSGLVIWYFLQPDPKRWFGRT